MRFSLDDKYSIKSLRENEKYGTKRLLKMLPVKTVILMH